MTNIYSLRVSRRLAGRHFPFDRIYLLDYKDRSSLHLLFRYALVMPVEGALRDMLEETIPDVTLDRPFDRDDITSTKNTISEADWKTFVHSKPWVMAVPILPKYMTQNMPRYIVAAGWFKKGWDPKKHVHSKTGAHESPFPNRTFLLTPTKKIRPVCVACPRLIMHQNGSCTLGEPECYQHLAMGIGNHFEEGREGPDATPNPKEPEAEAFIHGDLPSDAP